MPPYSQSNNVINSSSYISGGNKKTNPRKLLLIAVGMLATIAVIAFIIILSQPGDQQSKDLKSATTAARKQTPHAKVTDLKVADGFAVSIVSDPTAQGQANSGNQTYFKVNKDGSMIQIANGSYFNPIVLLGLGIPLTTQSKLAGRDLSQTQQTLADACGYSGGNEPGYLGFEGSFPPGDWQIDAGTLDGIEQTLNTMISGINTQAKDNEQIICVNATREKSNTNTDKQTYISTYTLELQFITSGGKLTTHTFSFAVGPNYYRDYTLDGQKIQAS